MQPNRWRIVPSVWSPGLFIIKRKRGAKWKPYGYGRYSSIALAMDSVMQSIRAEANSPPWVCHS